MKEFRLPLVLFLSVLMLSSAPGLSQERDRVGGDFKRADADGDGKLDRDEWRRRGNFDRLDADRDGYLNLPEVRALYDGHGEKSYDWPPPGFARSAPEQDPGAAADRVDSESLDRKIRCAIGRGRKCKPKAPVKRGLFETGLGPVFPEGAVCPGIDDTYALDYSFKRAANPTTAASTCRRAGERR